MASPCRTDHTPPLVEALQRINLFRMLQHAVSERRTVDRAMPPDWHAQLIDAIMTGDPDVASKAMSIHVQDSPYYDLMNDPQAG